MNIFISYINKEKHLAGKIKDALEGFGFTCFLAHEDIKPTEQWAQTILGKLDECQVFVPVLTKTFKKSEWTNQEVGYALARNKFIIPIKTGDYDPPGFLARFQALKYNTEHKFPLDKFLDTLEKEPVLKKVVNKIIIERFCESTSYMEANKYSEFLGVLKDLDSAEMKKIMYSSTTNRQIFQAVVAQRQLRKFLEKHNLKGVPRKIINSFREMFH